MTGRLVRAACACACFLLLLGCAGPGYLLHAARGQLWLILHRRPVEKVIEDPAASPRLKGLLSGIAVIKAYGVEFGLKPTPDFRDYVQLDRPAVTYVVSASKPLRFEAKTWSFPVTGSVTYLGWFDLAKASACAAGLAKEGWDADLRGASAYSTLGWFRDPVLSSMISDGREAEGDLAETVLHESVHSTFYVKGQTAFNESLAGFVARRLTPGYLDRVRGEGSPEKKAWLEEQEEDERRRGLVERSYRELDSVYASSRTDPEKLSEKSRVLSTLQRGLGSRRPLNNASLLMERSYESGRPEFGLLFEVCGRDWPRFFSALKTLKPQSFVQPQEDDFSREINALSRGGCKAS